MGTAYVQFKDYVADKPVRLRLSLTQFDEAGSPVVHYITVDIRAPMSGAEIANIVKMEANLQDAIKSKIVNTPGTGTLQINSIEVLDHGTSYKAGGPGGILSYAAYPAPVDETEAPDGPVAMVPVPSDTLGNPGKYTYPSPSKEIEQKCKDEANARKRRREPPAPGK